MACFITPTTAAIVATAVRKKVPQKYHFDWLVLMLWGGTVMLIIDHIVNGEIVFYPPFLTAMKNGTEFGVILKEIATLGVAMTVGVVFLWLSIVLVVNLGPRILRKQKLKTIDLK